MAYCTYEEMRNRTPDNEIVELTDDTDSGVADFAVVDRAITDAQAIVDAYCGGRYPVPFVNPSPLIRTITADLAIYNLQARKRPALSEEHLERKNAAMKLLEAIQAGKLFLGSYDPPSASGFARCNKTAADRVFTTDTLKGY